MVCAEHLPLDAHLRHCLVSVVPSDLTPCPVATVCLNSTAQMYCQPPGRTAELFPLRSCHPLGYLRDYGTGPSVQGTHRDNPLCHRLGESLVHWEDPSNPKPCIPQPHQRPHVNCQDGFIQKNGDLHLSERN